MKSLPYLALSLGVWTAFGATSPQQQVEAPPVLSIKTDLVTLPVTVVDTRGRYVTGLSKDQFTVYDGGQPQTVELFTSEDIPTTVGLVIDSSGSMRGRRDAVTAAAIAFADVSHPLDEFFTLHFNEDAWLGLPPDRPFTGDMGELRAALAAPAAGLTALYDAVDLALDHLELGTRDRKALIVVSDGGDNASELTLDAVLERARRTSAVIYAVTLFDSVSRDARPGVLKKLASDTGGRAFTPKRTDDLMTVFVHIAGEIRTGYTIGFSPSETRASGFRPVRVVADAGDGRKLEVRTRAGYYAGPSGDADR